MKRSIQVAELKTQIKHNTLHKVAVIQSLNLIGQELAKLSILSFSSSTKFAFD